MSNDNGCAPNRWRRAKQVAQVEGMTAKWAAQRLGISRRSIPRMRQRVPRRRRSMGRNIRQRIGSNEHLVARRRAVGGVTGALTCIPLKRPCVFVIYL